MIAAVFALGFTLAILATPYLTYLLKDAEIFDSLRAYALRSEFVAELLDCEKCTSQWAGFICMTIAIASIVVSLWLGWLYALPGWWLLGSLASATISVVIYNHSFKEEENKEA